jgi:pimeloyl-ACP methyl ester carboxylesterase
MMWCASGVHPMDAGPPLRHRGLHRSSPQIEKDGTMHTDEHTLRATSADGTTLTVTVDGSGPPLVLVHGSLVGHHHLDPLVTELRPSMTCYAMDRRGFGGSGDADVYDIEREFDDVAAVVDHVAALTGGPVALFGHSFGASCAMGSAVRTDNVAAMILYEPSLGLVYPEGVVSAIEAAVDAGDPGTAADIVLREILEMTEEELDEMHETAAWHEIVANGQTIAREANAEEAWTYRPEQFAAVTVPTVLLSGTESPPDLQLATRRAAEAIPGAVIRPIDGHGHTATQDAPALLARLILVAARDAAAPRPPTHAEARMGGVG